MACACMSSRYCEAVEVPVSQRLRVPAADCDAQPLEKCVEHHRLRVLADSLADLHGAMPIPAAIRVRTMCIC